MTADIINLRQARKQRARTQRELAAAENRAKHGKSKVTRLLDEARREQQSKSLDGHRRGDAPGDGGEGEPE